MRMIQTAVQLPDVLPTAAAPSGMRAAASPRSPEQGAGFEKMLQFSRAAGTEAKNARPVQVASVPSQAQAGRPGMAQGKQQGGEPVAESLTLAQMAGDADRETDEVIPGEPDEALAAMLQWDLLMPEADTSVTPEAGAQEGMLQVALKQDVETAGAPVERQQEAPVATGPVRQQGALQVQATAAQQVQATAAQQVQATAAPSGDAVPAMSVSAGASAGRQQPAPDAADTVRPQPAQEGQVASVPPGRAAGRENGAKAGSAREAESALVQKAAAQGSAAGTLSRMTAAPEESESAGVARQEVASEDAPGEAAPKTAQVPGVTVQSSQKQGPVLQEAQSGARVAEGQLRQQDEKAAQQALVREPVAQAEPEVAEQMVVAPRSQEQVAGKETASTPATGAVSSAPKQAGGEHSGAAGEERAFEQKMQVASAGAGESSAVGTQAAEEGKFAQAVDKADRGHSSLHQNVLSQIRDGVVIHDGKGNGQMSIRLNPGELGELKIQVRMEDHRLKVEVQAENRTVRDLLMSNLDSLKQALSGKNLAMEGFDVSTGGGFNSPAQEQRENHRQAMLRSAMGGGYPAGEERQVRYSTPDGDSLLDVRL